MIVLVTGGTGFLGSRLIELLIESNPEIEIHTLVRNTKNLGCLSRLRDRSRIVLHEGTLKSAHLLRKIMSQYEIVYHLAEYACDWGKEKDFIKVNCFGTELLSRIAQVEGHLTRFVYVSSISVYGFPSEGIVDETYELDDNYSYGSSKAVGERLLINRSLKGNLPYVIIRPGNIYGAGSKGWINNILEASSNGCFFLVNGGNAPANVVYIDHLCNAIIFASTNPKSINKIYNIIDEPQVSWRVFIQKVNSKANRNPAYISLPSWFLYFIAAILAIFYRLFSIYSSRPGLTHSMISSFTSRANYITTRSRDDLKYKEIYTLDEALERSIIS